MFGNSETAMLTTPEIIREENQRARLDELLPGWLARVPLYQHDRYQHDRYQRNGDGRAGDWLKRLPFITKGDIRFNFPHNFLSEGTELDSLLDRDLVEVEHTSGTTEERTA